MWSDNQAVVHMLNSFKPHATTVHLLRAVVDLQRQGLFTLRAAFIPTALNTTADLLSRITHGAQNSSLAIRPSLFIQRGGLRCNAVLCADDAGRTVKLLLGQKRATRPPTWCSPARCMFAHGLELAGRAVWFNPPYSLLEDCMALLRAIHAAKPHRTFLLGVVPYLPDRAWFHANVGPGRLFTIDHILRGPSRPYILTGTASFRSIPFAELPLVRHSEHAHLARAIPFDLAFLRADPLPDPSLTVQGQFAAMQAAGGGGTPAHGQPQAAGHGAPPLQAAY